MDRYVVVGNPIEHSKSPEIHRAFAKQVGDDIDYQKQLIDIEQFGVTMSQLFNEGLKGANVTVPFKHDAFEWVEGLTDRAQRAGAVNTLYLESSKVIGDNTDGVGMVRDIVENHKGQLAKKRLLILGAGGAVRGVLAPLLAEQPTAVVIANRTVSRAEQLVNDFADLGKLSAISYDALNQQAKATDQQNTLAFDWIINGTSTGLSGEVPPIPAELITESLSVYDMFYSKNDTPFIQWCKRQGAVHCFDGLGMLVEQAAESFSIWRGKRPDTRKVIESLSTP